MSKENLTCSSKNCIALKKIEEVEERYRETNSYSYQKALMANNKSEERIAALEDKVNTLTIKLNTIIELFKLERN